MKLTPMLFLAGMMQVSASTFGQQISLSRKNVNIESVLKEIRKQSGYDFFYDGKIIPPNKVISVQLSNATVEQALNSIFTKTSLSYKIEGKIVSIWKNDLEYEERNHEQKLRINVTGRVVDESGKPIEGATVRVKDRDQKTSTDENGDFRLSNIEEGSILQISHLSYIEELRRAKENMGNIELELFKNEIDEVNVEYSTGYQNLSRARSAGSYSKPNINIMKNRSSSTNILQRLDGLVPGLTVNNSTDAEPLLIRGLTSVNSTRAPLVVVDGVELQGVSIETVNMQDVEDITVLKDAASSSIWGAKAANGVIVITTKKGRPGDKLRIDYDGYYNFQGRPDLNYIQRMKSADFINTAKELFPQYYESYPWSSVQSVSAVSPHLDIQYSVPRGLLTQAQADRMLDSLSRIDNRDQISQLIYRNAATTNHTLSVTGGGPVHSFYGSLNYIGVKNSTPGDKDNRFKVNLRQDLNFGKRLQLFLVTDLSTASTGANNISNLLTSSETGYTPITTNIVPYQLLQDANGNPLTVNYMGGYSDLYRRDYQSRSRVNLDFAPLEEINRGRSNGTALSGRIVGGGKLNLYRGLRFEGTYGYNIATSNRRVVLDQNSYMVRNELMTFTKAASSSVTPTYYLPNVGGRLTESNSTTKNWTVRNQFIYDADWNDKNQLTVLAGQEATSTTPLSTEVIYRGWDDQLQISRPVDYETLAKGITGTVRGGTRTLDENYVRGGEGVISRTSSYYSNLNYSYLRKYTLNASWRIDRSNLFGFDKSAQNRPVYSVGGKWAMGKEEFIKKPTWLNELDIRYTYGVTGNAPSPGTASSYDILAAESNVNYIGGTGVIISSPANSKLTWESTKVNNFGLDFVLMNGKLGGSIDFYMKKTEDLIGTLSTVPLTGFTGVTGNFGDLENKGIDISLNSINMIRKDFMWNSGFTLGYNRNKITRLARTTPFTTASEMIDVDYVEGYASYAMFAYNYEGLNAEGNPQIRLHDGTLFSDIEGAVPADLLYKGTSQPIWSGGFSNNLQYKNIQLSFNLSYNAGHKMFVDGNSFWSGVVYENAFHPEFSNRWKEAGDENRTDIPKYIASGDENSERNTTYYSYANSNIFDASFLKMRDITLSYGLSDKLVKKIKAQAINFRFQVSNIMLWKANHSGIDPEFMSSRGGRVIRSGQGQITVGAHITL